MKDINLTVISGRLTADPLFRETKNGRSFCYFGLASNNFFKKDDNWQKEPTFVLVKCWNDLAIQSFEALKKGSQVIVYGKLKYSTIDSDTQNRKSINYIQAQKIDKVPKLIVKEPANSNIENSILNRKKKVKQIKVDDENLVSVEN